MLAKLGVYVGRGEKPELVQAVWLLLNELRILFNIEHGFFAGMYFLLP